MTISIVKKQLGVLFAILQASKFTCIYSFFPQKQNYLLLNLPDFFVLSEG